MLRDPLETYQVRIKYDLTFDTGYKAKGYISLNPGVGLQPFKEENDGASVIDVRQYVPTVTNNVEDAYIQIHDSFGNFVQEGFSIKNGVAYEYYFNLDFDLDSSHIDFHHEENHDHDHDNDNDEDKPEHHHHDSDWDEKKRKIDKETIKLSNVRVKANYFHISAVIGIGTLTTIQEPRAFISNDGSCAGTPQVPTSTAPLNLFFYSTSGSPCKGTAIDKKFEVELFKNWINSIVNKMKIK